MSIDCAFNAFLTADAEPRVSGAGKSWVRLRAGTGRDDAVQWVQIAVFGAAAEKAATLKKFDRIYVEGSLTARPWQANDGTLHAGLNVAAFKCERTHNIGRNKPSQRKEKEFDGQAPGPAAGAAEGGSQFSDEIPF
jgi:single-stranded DNA-binding protein